jgi:hypothetical protein
MSARDRRTVALVSLALAASVSAGCSQSPNASPSPAARDAAASAQASPEPPRITGDTRACLGVQGVLGHVAAGTARWSPQRQPFDRAVASRIRLSSDQLASQGAQAQTPRVRAAVRGIAQSFRSLSVAMVARDRREVSTAMAETRTSYKALKSTCALD